MAYIKTTWEDLPSEETPITSANLQKIEDALAGMLDYFYPVGTIYETTSTDLDTTTKMATHFGGTWEAYGAGRFTVGFSSGENEFNEIGKTGGSKFLQKHSHKMMTNRTVDSGGSDRVAVLKGKYAVDINTENSGDGQDGNLPPYIAIYRYRRIT